MRAELSELVEWCAAHFDLTIFDMPPVLAVTDPVILARTIGTSLFVARHDVSLIGEVDASLKTFTAAGVRLSGAILNGFDPRKAGPGYGYGYGYGYRYTYEKRDE
jgi:tyrosine-protein kinase Etk/Wzc